MDHFHSSSAWLANITPYTAHSNAKVSFHNYYFHGSIKLQPFALFVASFFSLCFPSRSGIPLPPSSTLRLVRSWYSMVLIFVSSLFSSSFCSQLRRARIKPPQGTTTSTPLMPSIACHRHMFNPLPYRDPTSNRKKNQTGLQPQKGRL